MTPQQLTECVTSQTNLDELYNQAIMKLVCKKLLQIHTVPEMLKWMHFLAEI